MITYREFLESIKPKIDSSYPQIIHKIKDLISTGSTGGEIDGIVGYYAINLKLMNPEVYNLIEKEIQDFIKSLANRGAIIKKEW